MKKHLPFFIYLFLFAIICFIPILCSDTLSYVTNVKLKDHLIVIDAGHGGNDPGKVGIHGELEKEINLQIAMELDKILKKKGIKTILTRTSYASLADSNATNKKTDDLNKRLDLIKKSNPDFVISIHQNSFSDSSVFGPQVFYYNHSELGQTLSTFVQASLIQNIAPNSTRTIKANDSYYILKNSDIPTIITECGFLSNPEDAMNLSSPSYQKKVANALYLGIASYYTYNAKED